MRLPTLPMPAVWRDSAQSAPVRSGVQAAIAWQPHLTMPDRVTFGAQQPTAVDALADLLTPKQIGSILTPINFERFHEIGKRPSRPDLLRLKHAEAVIQKLQAFLGTVTLSASRVNTEDQQGDVHPQLEWLWSMEGIGGYDGLNEIQGVRFKCLTVDKEDLWVDVTKTITPGTADYPAYQFRATLVPQLESPVQSMGVTLWRHKNQRKRDVFDFRQFGHPKGPLIFHTGNDGLFADMLQLTRQLESRGFFRPWTAAEKAAEADRRFAQTQGSNPFTGTLNPEHEWASLRFSIYRDLYDLPIPLTQKLRFLIAGLRDPHALIYDYHRTLVFNQLLKDPQMTDALHRAVARLRLNAPPPSDRIQFKDRGHEYGGSLEDVHHAPFSTEYDQAEQALQQQIAGH